MIVIKVCSGDCSVLLRELIRDFVFFCSQILGFGWEEKTVRVRAFISGPWTHFIQGGRYQLLGTFRLVDSLHAYCCFVSGFFIPQTHRRFFSKP